MSFFDKFLGLDDDDEYYDDEDLYEEELEEEPKKKKSLFKKKDDTESDNSPVERKSPPKFTPIRNNKKGSGTPMEVCIIKPTSFEDSKDVVNTILSERTVLLNIEGLDIGIAQRIIDFTSGASFAVGGTLQKVSNYIFVVTPASVDISGDLAGIMDAFDFSGVQTGF
ncbi:MAG TPA: cell division protein SepF [Lachnospiraceae bacterium]|nr:cell division protein SepF [Lachnospiraceae bacterium]